jgi:hypothetical protein
MLWNSKRYSRVERPVIQQIYNSSLELLLRLRRESNLGVGLDDTSGQRKSVELAETKWEVLLSVLEIVEEREQLGVNTLPEEKVVDLRESIETQL